MILVVQSLVVDGQVVSNSRIAGEVGEGVTKWENGQRAGVGRPGGQDYTFRACRRERFRYCQNQSIPRPQPRHSRIP